MEENNLISEIQSFNFFVGLDDQGIRYVANLLKVEKFSANDLIFNQGEFGSKVYFIRKGDLEVFIINKSGNEVLVSRLGAASYFGEMAILVNNVRTSSVRAITNCELLSISKENFLLLLKTYPILYQHLNKILTERLARTLNLLGEHEATKTILLICSDNSLKREQEFLQYFETVNRSFYLLNDPFTESDLLELKQQSYNYLMIRVREKPSELAIRSADHIVNFVEINQNHFCILENASQWQIEHTVREIANKTIGIALCSGGLPGIAHLGILKILQEEKIPLDYIVGTSAGALYGACYAFDCSPATIIDLISSEHKKLLLRLLTNFAFNFSGKIRTNYHHYLFKLIFGDKMMEDARVPFAALASDLNSGKTIVLKEGKVVDAILASNCLPLLMQPVIKDDSFLIDGVSTDPLGIPELIAQNIAIKIAAPIPQLDTLSIIKRKPKALTVYLRSRSMMAEKLVVLNSSLADVIITPKIQLGKKFHWSRIPGYIEAGEEAAKAAVKRIKYLLKK